MGIYLLVLLYDITTTVTGPPIPIRGIGNAVGAPGKRPIVKTAVVRGKAAGNAVASIGNGFMLGVVGGVNRLRTTYMKFGGIIFGPRGRVIDLVVRRSAGILKRIIIATLNVAHRTGSLKCSMRGLKNSKIIRTRRSGFIGTLDGHVTNIRVAGSSNNVKTSSDVRVHNRGFINKCGCGGSPLFIMSNIPVDGGGRRSAQDFAKHRSCGGPGFASNRTRMSCKGTTKRVGRRSVRDISVLGNPGTSTLCNTHTTGKIVLVAAGDKGKRGKLKIACDSAISFRATLQLPRFRGDFNRKLRKGCTCISNTKNNIGSGSMTG